MTVPATRQIGEFVEKLSAESLVRVAIDRELSHHPSAMANIFPPRWVTGAANCRKRDLLQRWMFALRGSH